MREKLMSRKCVRRHRIVPYTARKEAMSQQEPNSNGDIIKDFQSSGRTGRRNAMADVLGAHKDVSTSDLPLKLEKLSTNDDSVPEAEKRNNCVNNCEKVVPSSSSSTSPSSSSS